MYSKHEVGQRIDVWTIGDKKNTQAVISARGGQSIINSTFAVPAGVKFYFDGPHGYLLTDPDLLPVIHGEVNPLEELSAGNRQDYGLSKFQGAKHGGTKESDQDIEGFGVTTDELLSMGFASPTWPA